MPRPEWLKKSIDPRQTTSIIAVIDGGGVAIEVGQKGYVQIPFACEITGWSVLADASGSIEVDIDRQASSAPPTDPGVPDNTTDKISASAPVELSSAQTASGGSSEISTWDTALAAWDVLGFTVSSVADLLLVTVQIHVRR